MEKVVLNFFKKNQINYKKSKFLLAVSGGADSMCLAYVFKKLNLPCEALRWINASLVKNTVDSKVKEFTDNGRRAF